MLVFITKPVDSHSPVFLGKTGKQVVWNNQELRKVQLRIVRDLETIYTYVN